MLQNANAPSTSQLSAHKAEASDGVGGTLVPIISSTGSPSSTDLFYSHVSGKAWEAYELDNDGVKAEHHFQHRVLFALSEEV